MMMVSASLPVAATTGENSRQCTPTSLLNELDQRDRFKLEQLLRDAGNIENGGHVFWKVERDGVAPSYLFGTIHITDESLAPLRPAVREAIARSKTVALETVEVSSASMRSVMAEAGKLLVATDRSLQKLLAEDELGIVERAIMKAGYPQELALGLKPWAAIMFLADSECQQQKQKAGFESLDMLVANEARRHDIKIVGLENLLEQYEAMAALEDDAQTAWLKASVHLHDRIDDMVYTMAELYRFRRIGILWNLTRELAPQAGLNDATLQSIQHGLVSRRNGRMFERAVPMFEAGGVFVAVGILHLIGGDGLVARLRQSGFTVTAIE
jgi:uncharacterized protein YbaP (TraB family)